MNIFRTRWRRTKLCWNYGGSCDPLDVDQDFVRKGREVRYVETTSIYDHDAVDEMDAIKTQYHWRSPNGDPEDVTTVGYEEWYEWTGGSVQLVEPAPWYWWWDWAIWLGLKLRGEID